MAYQIGDKVTIKNGKTVYTVVSVNEAVEVVQLISEKNRRAVAYFHEITGLLAR